MECDPTGSLCRSVITYPLVTGKVNVSFGDITAGRWRSTPWMSYLSLFPMLISGRRWRILLLVPREPRKVRARLVCVGSWKSQAGNLQSYDIHTYETRETNTRVPMVEVSVPVADAGSPKNDLDAIKNLF